MPGAKQTWLGAAQGLAVAAAYALARIGAPAAGFLALERGRARVLTEAIQRDRADLADVAALDPGAYAAYEQAAGSCAPWRARNGRRERPSRSASTTPRAVSRTRPARRGRICRRRSVASSNCQGHAGFGQSSTIDEVAERPTRLAPRRPRHHRRRERGPPRLARRRLGGPGLRGDLGAGADDGSAQRCADHRPATEKWSVATWPASWASQDALSTALADGLPVVGTSLMGPLAARLRELQADRRRPPADGPARLTATRRGARTSWTAIRAASSTSSMSAIPPARSYSGRRCAVAAREAQPRSRRGGQPAAPSAVARICPGRARGGRPLLPRRRQPPAVRDRRDRDGIRRALPRATHVHLACHGRFDADTPLDSSSSWPARMRPMPPVTRAVSGSRSPGRRLVRPHPARRAVRLPDGDHRCPAPARRGDRAAGRPAPGRGARGDRHAVVGRRPVDDPANDQVLGLPPPGRPGHRRGTAPAGGRPAPGPGLAADRTADELVALLAADRSLAAAEPSSGAARACPPAAEAGVGVRQLGLEDPTSRPYADPYYWAPSWPSGRRGGARWLTRNAGHSIHRSDRDHAGRDP